ncbi:proteasome ATPase [Arthrobacter cryoconiti]
MAEETFSSTSGVTPGLIPSGPSAETDPPAPGSYSAAAGAQTALERQLNVLREKTRNLDRQLASATQSNTRLTTVLESAKSQILKLRQALENDGQPPYGFGTVMSLHPAKDAATGGVSAGTFRDDQAGGGVAVTAESIDIYASGRKMRVGLSPLLQIADLSVGQEVLLNEAFVIIAGLGFERVGEIVTVKELLGTDRAMVVARGEDERVVRLSGALAQARLRVGDAVTMDGKTGYALEKIPRSEVENLILEEVPNISYADIGGLSSQIEQIRDAVELPFLHPDLYREHGLKPPKGILLYGPPGCGKTLIAKAVANSLAKRAAERSGAQAQKSYFLNIKGPELLDKYVGETERQIRLIFSRAREKAADGSAVVVFFDEMDSLFRTRGTGISSDVETTIVPQLLSEIDGVERLDNVIVIGASNREDMIDPAILRPGRLDVKVKINRPDAEAAADIFAKYITEELPFHNADVQANHGSVQETVDAMIGRTVEAMYSTDKSNEYLEVTYANGDTEMLYFKDFNSGAVIQNVVDRAKKYAIKDLLQSGERGIRIEHLLRAVVDEFREHEDMPNTTNPDDWARISGKKGERITYIRTIVQSKQGQVPGKTLETVRNTGQYL